MSCNRLIFNGLALLVALSHSVGIAQDESPVKLWTGSKPFPAANEMTLVDQKLVKYQTVHRAEKPMTFAIGAAITEFNGELRSSWAANPDGVSENLGTEFVRERVSTDNGATWSNGRILAPQLDGGAFQSHGSYMNHKGTLYFFGKLGPFTGPAKGFVLGADGKSWEDKGVVTVDGATFWPMDTPQQMENGQWIMGGLGGEGGKFPAVAIADDESILKWNVKLLPKLKFRGFGETTVITKENEVLAISRNGALKSPMITTSADAGKTWEASRTANFPMVPAKPYAGRLSDGRPYLIYNIPPVKKAVGRSRLCLLIGPAQGMSFDRAWLLRPNDPPAARFSGPQHKAQWAYPYAHESRGALYIAHHNAKEDVELIVVPLAALK